MARAKDRGMAMAMVVAVGVLGHDHIYDDDSDINAWLQALARAPAKRGIPQVP